MSEILRNTNNPNQEEQTRMTFAQARDFARENLSGMVIDSTDKVQLPEQLERHVLKGGSIVVDILGNITKQFPIKNKEL